MSLIIAVSGAAGLLGSMVCKLALEDGHTVLGLDRIQCTLSHPRFTSKVIDTSNYDTFRGAVTGCNAIVHLAAVLPTFQPPQAEIHNVNTTSSFNALQIAADLGVIRVVQASSVNVIGLAFSRRPQLDYLPLDENHPWYPEDAYSLSKCICEQQASAIARRHPNIRIASLRFHWVIPSRENGTSQLSAAGPSSPIFAEHTRDLWGWVSLHSAARACLLGLTASENAWQGHEAFFIVAPNTLVEDESEKLRNEVYPEVKVLKRPFMGNMSFFDCSKAERVLGWREESA